MQTIKLDISQKNNVQTIYVKQRDVGHKFAIELYENGVPYEVDDENNFAVWFSGASGDGNYTAIGDETAVSVDGNRIEVQMIMQMLNEPGDHEMCIVMYGQDNHQKGFWNVPYLVEAIPGADSEGATDYYNAFLGAQGAAEAAAVRAEEAADRAEEAADRAEKAAEDTFNAAESVADKKPQDLKVTATFDTPVDDTTVPGIIITNGYADVSAYAIAVAINNGATAILVDNDDIVYEYNGYRLEPNYSRAFFRAQSTNANGITSYSVTIDNEGNASRSEYTHGVVLYTTQTPTPEQQAQARENIKAATIDDTKAGAEAWSSKNTVDRLCPAFAESGPAVSCEPVEGYPLQVVSRIEPVQSGTGDPSPDNIRPISGHSALNLTQSNQDGTIKTFEIDLGQTVYGGNLDWNTGVLTVDKKVVVADGTKNAFVTSSSGYWRLPWYTASGTALQTQIVNSHFPAVYFATATGGEFIYVKEQYITNEFASVEEFNTYLIEQNAAGTPLQMQYDLEEPITIQLTPQEITALSGINTLYSDTGDTEVTGRANPATIINNLHTRLAAIEAAVVNNA